MTKAPSRAHPKTGWDKNMNLFFFTVRPRMEEEMRCHFFSGLGRIVDKHNNCIYPYGFLGRGIQWDHSFGHKE